MKAHIRSGCREWSGPQHDHHHDITEADHLLHDEEQDVFADSGYRGIEKREEHKNRKVNCYITMMPGKRKQLDKTEAQERLE